MIGQEPIEIPINGILDLHTFQPSDANDLVPGYLESCWELGIVHVRIIHGKSTGMLRQAVQSMLKKLEIVESFQSAGEEAGGWGATLVVLRKKEAVL